MSKNSLKIEIWNKKKKYEIKKRKIGNLKLLNYLKLFT